MFYKWDFLLLHLDVADFDRMEMLVEQHVDWSLGGTDASIVALQNDLL